MCENKLEVQTIPTILLLPIVHVSLNTGTKRSARLLARLHKESASDQARVFAVEDAEVLTSSECNGRYVIDVLHIQRTVLLTDVCFVSSGARFHS